MFKLVKIVVEFKEYITLSMLIIICFALMSMGNAAELRGFRTIVVGGIGVAQRLFAWVPNPVALKSENKALRELNFYLSTEFAKSRKALVENEKLRTALEFKESLDFPVLSAELVGRTTAGMRNYVTLNVGRNDKVQEGMAVMTERGLVGSIIAASDNYSLVQLVINIHTRIAVKVEETRVNGILLWEGSEELLLTKVAKSLDVEAGDRVLTSGYSTKYPAGIVVGQITQVRDDPSSLFRTITVRPLVNFETLEQVFVRLELPDAERLALRKQLEEKLRTKE